MVKKILWLLLATIAIYSVVPVSATPLIGCEDGAEYVRCFNNGTIAPTNYLNKSSGFLQHGNEINRMDDVTYFVGLGRNVSGTIQYYGITSYPSITEWATDNATYWWAAGRLNVTAGGGTQRFIKNLTQKLNDDYVNITFQLSRSNAIRGGTYFVTGFKDLDIDNDAVAERFILSLGNGSVEEWDNRTGTYWWTNVTRIVIDGGPGTYSYDLIFPKGVLAYYNHTSPTPNGQFIFLDYIGSLAANVSYNFSYYWIDAACTHTCPSGCSVVADLNVTGFPTDTYTQGTPFINMGCRALQSGVCIGRCSISADCNLYWAQNSTSTYTTITTTDRDRPLKCISPSCQKTSNTVGTFYYRNTTASKIGSTLYACGLQSESSISWSEDVELFITRGDPQVSLWSPANNTLLNASYNWAVFGANNTGNITADNITLYFNNTANYTSAPNLTINRTFDFFACYVFNVRACYSHNCPYNQNGNFTICQNGTQIILPGGVVISVLPPKKRDPFRQLDIEDKGILAIGGAIILVGVFLTFWRAKSTKEGDLVANYSEEIKK